jgi:hypothetical protein
VGFEEGEFSGTDEEDSAGCAALSTSRAGDTSVGLGVKYRTVTSFPM